MIVLLNKGDVIVQYLSVFIIIKDIYIVRSFQLQSVTGHPLVEIGDV